MKRSRSIQPRESTCCRMLAFWPPPNAVDEIAANVSAMLVATVRGASASQLTSGIGPSTTGEVCLPERM